MFSLNPFRVSSSEYCVTCYWVIIDYVIYFCVCCFVYSNVDIVSVCAAICLGVDTPQVTPFNSCTGGGHIVRRHSLCCCAAYNWSRDTVRLKLGVQSKIGGAIIFFSICLNVLPFGSLLTGAKWNVCIYSFVDLTHLLKDTCGV